MENEPQFMPKIDLFPRLAKIGEFILDHLPTYLPNVPLARGDHTFEANHGGGPLLDQSLDQE